MRILVFGAGVIGSVYASKLLQAGHDVVLLARGQRLSDLRTHGLILEEQSASHNRIALPVHCLKAPAPDDHYDLVLVAVRAEQLASTLPILTAMTDASDVLFFGNTAGAEADLLAALGKRAVFGFPAAGGVRDGSVVRYVLIHQQKTMLGEPGGAITPRVRRLRSQLNRAGFPTVISTNIDDWLVAHAAFVVPIAFALNRVGNDPVALAADLVTLRVMVRATRQGFLALCAAGNTAVPGNLRALYHLPTILVVWYWRRVFAGPRGEHWFAAHTRAAPQEMHALAQHLQLSLDRTGHRAPDLENLLGDSV